MTPKISVIVPVFNVEKWLRHCIDSILKQTFTDFELLLIDDGSKDSSGAICDEYAASDPRIRVFHKPNGGVSSARNLGLDNARGEWVTFVDSDDWIEADHIEDLLKNQDADFRVNTFKIEGSDENWPYKIPDKEYVGNVQLAECIAKYFSTNFRSPWGKRYKAQIIKDNTIKFNRDISVGEDLLFCLDYLAHVDSISLSSKIGTHYFRGNVDSLTQGNANYTPHEYITNVITKLTLLELRLGSNLDSVLFSLIMTDFNVAVYRIFSAKTTYREKFAKMKRLFAQPYSKIILSEKNILSKGKRRKLIDSFVKCRILFIPYIILNHFKEY